MIRLTLIILLILTSSCKSVRDAGFATFQNISNKTKAILTKNSDKKLQQSSIKNEPKNKIEVKNDDKKNQENIEITIIEEDENGDYNNQDNDKTNHINNNINQQNNSEKKQSSDDQSKIINFIAGTNDIPLYEGLEKINNNSNNFDFDSNSGSIISSSYYTNGNLENIQKFYYQSLIQMGWKMIHRNFHQMQFKREGENLTIDFEYINNNSVNSGNGDLEKKIINFTIFTNNDLGLNMVETKNQD